MPCSGSRAQLTLLLRAKIADDSICFLFNKQSYKQSVCVCAGWGQVVEGQGEIFFFFVVTGKARGDTPLFGLYGYVPLNRVWFSGSWVLQGVFLDRKPWTGGVNFGGVQSMFVIREFF